MFSKGFFLSTGITILLCGAVMYLCHLRLQHVEEAIIKQNQVLSAFIANVQADIRNGSIVVGGGHAGSSAATDEAKVAAAQIIQDRISVSDDEPESDTESEYDDGSDSDSCNTDSEDEVDLQVEEVVDDRIAVEDDVDIHLTELDATSDSIKIIHMVPGAAVSELEDATLDGLDISETVTPAAASATLPTSDAETDAEHSGNAGKGKLSYKIDDLRKKAIELGLITKENAKSFKKPELLELLKLNE